MPVKVVIRFCCDHIIHQRKQSITITVLSIDTFYVYQSRCHTSLKSWSCLRPYKSSIEKRLGTRCNGCYLLSVPRRCRSWKRKTLEHGSQLNVRFMFLLSVFVWSAPASFSVTNKSHREGLFACSFAVSLRVQFLLIPKLSLVGK